MKKFLLAIAIILTSISSNAQSQKCNRLFLYQKGEEALIYNMNKVDSISFSKTNDIDNLIVHNSNGVRNEFIVDNLDSLTFKSVEGRVAADVNIIDYTTTSMTIDVKRTESCVSYKMMCMDFVSISTMGDDDIIYYFDRNVSDVYDKDFENAEISGLNLSYDTEYAIVTVGIDEYGISCDVVRARFAIPSENLVGNPDVTVEVVENNLYDFTLLFTPNSEVSKYYVVVAEEGTMEYQYAIFSYMSDWNNMGDMIVDWGYEFSKKTTQAYTEDITPSTYYEAYIQALDKNGNRAPYKVFKFKSKSSGGEGVASVDIKLGDYIMSEWLNENYEWEMMPSQYFTFTPNDQTSAYRFDVMLEETYTSDIDGYQEDLCSEPSMQTSGWFQYEKITTDYQIDPNTKCVAIAAAKNINGEWGPVTELYFTTPSKMPGEEDEVTSITLKVNKNTIIANGKDVAKFTLKVNDTELTDGFQLVNVSGNYEMDQKSFSTTTAGKYSFMATYDGLTSNVVEVVAEEDKPATVELVASKTSIKNNGTDYVKFTVLVDGIDKTSIATIFNATSNEELSGTTFTSKNTGDYVFYATYNESRSNNISVNVKQARSYKPGDLYDEDGVKGVVYHLLNEEGTSGYIMSMDEASLQWSTENVFVNCTSDNGKYHTEDMLKHGADKYPAAKWCVEHGEGWYMPSVTELDYLWDAVSNGTHVFDNEYVKLYNDKLTDPIAEDYYWSSNETAEDLGRIVAFMENSYVCLDPQKSSRFAVRAIYKF